MKELKSKCDTLQRSAFTQLNARISMLNSKVKHESHRNRDY